MQDNQSDNSTHTLTSSGLTIGSGNMRLPTTVTFKSANAAKTMQISTDGGVEYFTPSFETETATMIVLVLNATVTNIQVTGDIGDALIIGQ